MRNSESKAEKPNFSRGSLKSAEVSGKGDDAPNESSSPHSSDEDGNENDFSEGSAFLSREDDDYHSFGTGIDSDADGTFREAISRAGSLKD